MIMKNPPYDYKHREDFMLYGQRKVLTLRTDPRFFSR